MGEQLPQSERRSGAGQRGGVEQTQRSEGMRGILRRALAYADRVFQLKRWWKRVRDSRRQPQIPTEVFPAILFVMFSCRLRSFHELPARWASLAVASGQAARGTIPRLVAWQRWLGAAKDRRMPCADEIAYVAERIDLTTLRDVLAHLYTRLMRNKVLQSRLGGRWRVAAVDGHEIGWSYPAFGGAARSA